MSGPCLCGAEDCKRCHPESFRDGRYIGDDPVREDHDDGCKGCVWMESDCQVSDEPCSECDEDHSNFCDLEQLIGEYDKRLEWMRKKDGQIRQLTHDLLDAQAQHKREISELEAQLNAVKLAGESVAKMAANLRDERDEARRQVDALVEYSPQAGCPPKGWRPTGPCEIGATCVDCWREWSLGLARKGGAA